MLTVAEKKRLVNIAQKVRTGAAAQAATAADSAAVLVICGGYHAPVLAREDGHGPGLEASRRGRTAPMR